MLISEVSRRTRLTKKAIEYYTTQNLIAPSTLDNGYRQYSAQDIEVLQKIGVLRKLDISIAEIRAIVCDETNGTLQAVSVRKELESQRDVVKRTILQKLSVGTSYADVERELQSIEQGKTITDKLLDAFPGYYGRFICMHMARFLSEPIVSPEQQAAYETMISFLDGVPMLEMPQELEDYLIKGTKHIGTEDIATMLAQTQNSIEHPDQFLAENSAFLEEYLAYKQTEEYKNSPACRLMALMREFNSTHGYYDVFIPAMQVLSPSYAEYHRQSERASEKIIERYPEISQLNQ